MNIDKIVLELAKHGCTVGEIVYYSKVPDTTTRRILDAYRVKPACRKDKTEKAIKELYDKGLNQSEIAEKLGLQRSTIRAHLRRMGLDTINGPVRFCEVCGKPFRAVTVDHKFCSYRCASDVRHHRRDRRIKLLTVDNDISLWKVAEIDNGICYLCGGLVDWNDFTVVNGYKAVHAKYPSVDHVKPLSVGGLHSWDNVRLAHHGCNSRKCDKFI